MLNVVIKMRIIWYISNGNLTKESCIEFHFQNLWTKFWCNLYKGVVVPTKVGLEKDASDGVLSY